MKYRMLLDVLDIDAESLEEAQLEAVQTVVESPDLFFAIPHPASRAPKREDTSPTAEG